MPILPPETPVQGMDPEASTESALSTLCRACGLCCDGSLFSHVPLEPAEVEQLEALGIPIQHRRSGKKALAQRCAALEGKDCRIYQARPGTCSDYRCLLADALIDGEVTLEQAQAKVKKAQHLVATGHARRFLRREFRGRKGLD
ncbi:MAG: YkgJ family cysteine cluster protein [Myxococcota bacterium]|nr:YkgJ family cysteine cluster protein [Myxococcota bacterium]